MKAKVRKEAKKQGLMKKKKKRRLEYI